MNSVRPSGLKQAPANSREFRRFRAKGKISPAGDSPRRYVSPELSSQMRIPPRGLTVMLSGPESTSSDGDSKTSASASSSGTYRQTWPSWASPPFVAWK